MTDGKPAPCPPIFYGCGPCAGGCAGSGTRPRQRRTQSPPERNGTARPEVPSKSPESCGRFFTGIGNVPQIFPEAFDGTGNQGGFIQLAAFHVQRVRFRIPEKMDRFLSASKIPVHCSAYHTVGGWDILRQDILRVRQSLV